MLSWLAEEDPGRWSITWYGTRYLFVKIFCFQNKNNVDSSNACFSAFTSSAVQVWAILPEKNPLYTEREKGQFLSFFLLPPAKRSLKHEPCTSRYMACVHSRCAMKLVHLELLVWTQTRGEKLYFVTVSFFTGKYPALIVSKSNMGDRYLKTEVSLWSL